ncbi:MAG: heme exporter protein CcmB [Gammaproteobacteria bacterium]|jgi:heme exporter protein B
MQPLSIGQWIGYPLKHEIKILLRSKSRWMQPVLFFCLLVTLFPMGLGASTQTIVLLMPTLIWIAVILSALWSAESAFQFDLEHGALEQMMLSSYPLWLWLLIRGFAYWLIVIFPMVLMGPALAWLFGLSEQVVLILACTLCLGTPGLTLLALIASGLTVCLRHQGLLLVLMMLPLLIPFVIFGVGSVNLILMGIWPRSELAWLGALSTLVLTLGPFAGSLGIQYSLDDSLS